MYLPCRPQPPWAAYAQSKTANAWFTLELHRRYANCQIAKPVMQDDPRNGYAPWAYDGEGAKRLFVESETLTGIRDE